MNGTVARAPQRMVGAGAVVVALTLLAGCPRHGLIDDGTSISYGPSNRGKLINPAQLPVSGEGYVIPGRWARRGLNYGTDELVALIIHAGRRIHGERPGSRFGVADLSRRRGGPSVWHRSHQTGRDADLLFFATDDRGNPVPMESMPRFGADGRALLVAEGQPARPDAQVLRFDVERNWLLVRALLHNPIAEVQYIFVYEPLKQLLLAHARASGEPEELIAQATFILQQPGDSLPHDDHFHVRIYCSPSDRMMGCHDRGALRWTKKLYKYSGQRAVHSALPAAMRAALATPMPAMMALGVFPFLP
jgi:penicillin-insensitive murein DD-endopeptidase